MKSKLLMRLSSIFFLCFLAINSLQAQNIKYEFNGNSFEGWSAQAGNGAFVSVFANNPNGALNITWPTTTASTKNVIMYAPAGTYNPANKYLKIRISNTSSQINSLRIRARLNGTNFFNAVDVAISTNTVGQYSVYEIDMNGNANWTTGTLDSWQIVFRRSDNNAITDNGTILVDHIAVYDNPTDTTTWWNGTAWQNVSPSANTDVIIDGTFATTTNIVPAFTAKSLTINTGHSFEVNNGDHATISGAIVNNSTPASFVVRSGADLLQTNISAVTNSGAITVKRQSASIQLLDYTLWSSPVAGQNLLAFSPNTLPNRFYTYNPATNLYNTVSAPASTTFDLATGYLIRAPNDWAASTPQLFFGSFEGVPNNGAITLSGLTANNYYAVGNPYPSSISADLFLGANSTVGTLYFWRKTNNSASPSYATYTSAGGTGTAANTTGGSSIIPNGKLQVGQGFIVKPTSTSLSFSNAMRIVNTTNQFLKTTTNEKSRFWLNLTNDSGVFSQTLVAYMQGATVGEDNSIDGKYIESVSTSLSSLINNEEFIIQGRPLPFSDTDIVPLGFKTSTAGNHTISLDNKDGIFSTGQQIYLIDSLLNTTFDLNSGAYTFTSAIGTFNNRFSIVYSSALTTVTNSFNANSVIVYTNNGSININSGQEIIDSIRVFDIQGRLLTKKDNVQTSETSINTNNSNQILLVEIKTIKGNVVTKKIIL